MEYDIIIPPPPPPHSIRNGKCVIGHYTAYKKDRITEYVIKNREKNRLFLIGSGNLHFTIYHFISFISRKVYRTFHVSTARLSAVLLSIIRYFLPRLLLVIHYRLHIFSGGIQ